jgi:hypothetical protein
MRVNVSFTVSTPDQQLTDQQLSMIARDIAAHLPRGYRTLPEDPKVSVLYNEANEPVVTYVVDSNPGARRVL